jgi:hypothetical protein
VENVNGPGSDCFSTQCVLEFPFERIVAQHAELELGTTSGPGRPIRQLREVKEKAGLHVILADSRLRLNEPGDTYKEEQKQETATWDRHTSEDSGAAALARRARNAIRYGTIHQQTPC